MRDQFKAPWVNLLIGMTGTVTLLMILLSLPMCGSAALALPVGVVNEFNGSLMEAQISRKSDQMICLQFH